MKLKLMDFRSHYIEQVNLQIKSQDLQIKELIENYGKLMELFLSTKNNDKRFSVIINDNESIDLLSTTLNNTVQENTSLKSTIINSEDMIKKIGKKNLELVEELNVLKINNIKLQNQVNFLVI